MFRPVAPSCIKYLSKKKNMAPSYGTPSPPPPIPTVDDQFRRLVKVGVRKADGFCRSSGVCRLTDATISSLRTEKNSSLVSSCCLDP